MREWWSKISRILRGRRVLDDDLREESRSHLDFLIEENIALATCVTPDRCQHGELAPSAQSATGGCACLGFRPGLKSEIDSLRSIAIFFS